MTDFEKIFSENQGFVFKFLLKLCKDSTLAEELTQETFFRAYMNISSVKNEGKIPVWLCQIAKNSYYTYLQKNKRLESLDSGAYTAEEGKSFTDKLEEREAAKQIQTILHRIEDTY